MEDRKLTFEMLRGEIDERMFIRGDKVDQRIAQSILGVFEDVESCDQGGGIFQNANGYTAHYIGETRLFHTFRRNSEFFLYQYAGLCEWGRSKNLHPRSSKKTFIISPYHAENPDDLCLHQNFAKALARDVIKRHGDVPILPHLYFPTFLSDEGWERDFGIEAGHLIMELCDSVIVGVIDGRISEGMEADIQYATKELAIEPEYRFFSRQAAKDFIRHGMGADDEERRAKH